MKAISCWQPWAYAIMRLGKRLENRGRVDGRVPLGGYTGPLLLHASKRWPKAWGNQLRAIGQLPQPVLEQLPGFQPNLSIEDKLRMQDVIPNLIYRTLGCVVGRVVVKSWIHQSECGGWWQFCPGRGIGMESIMPPPEDQLRWFAGPWAAELTDVEEFETPIPCLGRQGLFSVPPEVERDVLAAKVIAR